MRLSELEPELYKIDDERTMHIVDSIADADAIMYVCPKCFAANGNNRIGVHSVLNYKPHVPQERTPSGGRWNFLGSGIEDLTLQAGSSSVLLKGECNAHYFITNGEIVMCG